MKTFKGGTILQFFHEILSAHDKTKCLIWEHRLTAFL